MRRIDQWLANLGYCSRRESRAWVEAGRITIDGRPADDPGTKVSSQKLQVDHEPLDHPEGILLLLHKPLGLVCSHDENEGPSVYSLFPPRWLKRNPTINTIGRLDKETSGVLLLTDQSELIHRLTSPKHKVPKTYHATVDRVLSTDLIARFGSGELRLADENEPCAPATLRILSPNTAELTLTEGRYHQVRRMFAAQGYEVKALARTQFGPFDLSELAPGAWRELPLNCFSAAPSP